MKKYLFTLLLAAVCGMASAQEKTPSLRVGDIYIQPGQTASFALVVNVGDLAVKGFQYEKLTLPEGLSVTKQTTASLDGGSLSVNNTKGLYTNGKGLFIPTNEDVEIATIELKAAADMVTGPVTVTFPAGDFTFLDGTNYFPVEDEVSFNVIVANMLTLDENSEVVPSKNDTRQDVEVIRSFKANEWSTVYLPFTLSAAKVTDVFGEGTKIAQISGSTSEKDTEGNVTGITIDFTYKTGALSKNTPFIICPTKDIDRSFIAKDVVLDEPIDAVKTAISGTIPVWDEDEEDYINKTVEVASMTGTLKAGIVVPNGSLFISDNQFWYSTGLTKMKAFRAYITLYDKLSSFDAAPSRVKFFVTDGDQATEIQIPELMPNDGEYYNLNGLRVETPAKGIYIKNGKKVVVK